MGCARPDERVRRRGGFKNNRDEGVYVLSAVPPTACKCMAGTTHSAPVQGFRGASCADRSTADCRLPKPEMRVRLPFGAPRPFQTRARILRGGCIMVMRRAALSAISAARSFFLSGTGAPLQRTVLSGLWELGSVRGAVCGQEYSWCNSGRLTRQRKLGYDEGK